MEILQGRIMPPRYKFAVKLNDPLQFERLGDSRYMTGVKPDES
jgi:hypothetical protein